MSATHPLSINIKASFDNIIGINYPAKFVYMVWGCVPGSDDDTAWLVRADSPEEAESDFKDAMCDDIGEDEEEHYQSVHGTACFINGCELVGEVVE